MIRVQRGVKPELTSKSHVKFATTQLKARALTYLRSELWIYLWADKSPEILLWKWKAFDGVVAKLS